MTQKTGNYPGIVPRNAEVELSASRSNSSVASDVKETSDMLTEFQEKIPNCSRRTSSGKQKRAHPTSQPHFRSENTPPKLEADQILQTFKKISNPGKDKLTEILTAFRKKPVKP